MSANVRRLFAAAARRAPQLTIFVAIAGVFCAGPVTAQDWFRQRTYGVPAVVGPSSLTSPETVRIDASTSPLRKSFPKPNLLIDIPDAPNPGITSTVVVSGVDQSSSIKFGVYITHNQPADLRVTLTSPGGTVVTISDRQPGSGPDLDINEFGIALPPGAPFNGTWTLSVVDLSPGTVGRLIGWSLAFDVPNTAAIDLTMSLESDPMGDNKGNEQSPGNEQQDQWERIIQYFADAVYEMTNGAHRIRDVRIYPKSRHLGDATVSSSIAGSGRIRKL